MPRKYWWTGTASDKFILVQNFGKRIVTVGPELGLTPAQVTEAVEWCDAYMTAFSVVEECKNQMVAMTAWRDEVYVGEPTGSPVSTAPVFPVVAANTFTRGSLTQFMELRELIVALPAYTLSYGEELGIVGVEVNPIAPSTAQPLFKSVTTNGYTVNVAGSMKGFDAMRVEYAPKGGSYSTTAFLTNTPGGFMITPQTPGDAETGHIRAIYIKNNADVGVFSPDYSVTVS